MYMIIDSVMKTIIYSSKLGIGWDREIRVGRENKTPRLVLVFADAMPQEARLKVRLCDLRTRVEIVAVYLGRGNSTTAMDIVVRHEAPETYSRVTMKAALFEKAHLKFNGRIEIAPEAKGSDSYLLARSFLVSPNARAEIQPHLEIGTNEVNASHGSSIGRLDEKALFYLQSRGIPRLCAAPLILSDFFRDVAKDLPPSYQEKFFQTVQHSTILSRQPHSHILENVRISW